MTLFSKVEVSGTLFPVASIASNMIYTNVSSEKSGDNKNGIK